jgi:RNA polymerase sigma-70 factor, ECF subfamily
MSVNLPIPLNPVEETALVGGLQRGEQSAQEMVVRRFGGRMLAVAQRLLRHQEDAADAVQDAFLSAFKSMDQFEGQARLGTWLHRIVVNASLMKLRSRKRRPERSIEDLLPTFHDDGHRRHPRPAWEAPSDSLLEQQELCRIVRQKIDQLPEDYRNVLLLRDIEELNTDETARVLGINAGAVKTRLHRARMALRELLEMELAE